MFNYKFKLEVETSYLLGLRKDRLSNGPVLETIHRYISRYTLSFLQVDSNLNYTEHSALQTYNYLYGNNTLENT